MPEVTPEQIHAARNRWRAGLLRWHAAELVASAAGATATVASQLTASAAAKLAQADALEAVAALDEAYDTNRAALNAGDLSRHEWRAFCAGLQQARLQLRAAGEAAGERRQPNVDNFTEPTDAELKEALA